MKLKQHTTPFQMSTRCMTQAALADASDYFVEIVRLPGNSKRCLYYFDDTPEIRDLIDRFERREVIPIPAKTILNSRTELYHQSRRVVMEGL